MLKGMKKGPVLIPGRFYREAMILGLLLRPSCGICGRAPYIPVDSGNVVLALKSDFVASVGVKVGDGDAILDSCTHTAALLPAKIHFIIGKSLQEEHRPGDHIIDIVLRIGRNGIRTGLPSVRSIRARGEIGPSRLTLVHGRARNRTVEGVTGLRLGYPERMFVNLKKHPQNLHKVCLSYRKSVFIVYRKYKILRQ